MQKLTRSERNDVYEGWLTGASKTSLAENFNVSRRTIGRIIDSINSSVEADSSVEYITVDKAKKFIDNSNTTEEKPKPFSMIGSDSFITVVYEGKVYNCDSDHPQFENAMKAMKRNDHQAVIKIINTKEAVKSYTKGNIEIINNQLTYKGIVFDNSLTKRIIENMHSGKSFEPLLKFFKNLVKNPSRDVVYQLFDFMQHNDIKIDDDGNLICWKRVNSNYRDFYTNSIDNSVGKTVKIPRNTVDENKNKTCSFGLHVCAWSYIPKYHGGSGIIIQVKVNPKHVVAIPTDYNNSKMRCCRYKVMGYFSNGMHY
ncbi:rIIB protein [Pectobacterium phage POP12]|nr:rIIB protein [Pectobacterium phage POP12]